ncbi:MAG: hypothetical protein Q4A86_01165 [Clostridia bacterium]|nr:hypothetical protein [Clostridia bacterium]
MQNILSKRMGSLGQLLKQSAGQMEQYMILWDYQDKGYTHYRLRTNGDNCKDCTALNGEIFPIYKAESGVNFVPLHLRHKGWFSCAVDRTILLRRTEIAPFICKEGV